MFFSSPVFIACGLWNKLTEARVTGEKSHTFYLMLIFGVLYIYEGLHKRSEEVDKLGGLYINLTKSDELWEVTRQEKVSELLGVGNVEGKIMGKTNGR